MTGLNEESFLPRYVFFCERVPTAEAESIKIATHTLTGNTHQWTFYQVVLETVRTASLWEPLVDAEGTAAFASNLFIVKLFK